VSDRCFCGAEWNDVAEECAAGHPFGEAEKLRADLARVTAENERLRDRASHGHGSRYLSDCDRCNPHRDTPGCPKCDADLPALTAALDRADRAEADLARVEKERDKARERAATYERDWYDAKSEFGDAMAKANERVRRVEDERDEALRALTDLVDHGGALVCSGICSTAEITAARAFGRLYVRADGIGYVRRPAEGVPTLARVEHEEKKR
jgi:hypothetical protein